VHQRRHRAEDAGQVGAEQRAGAVLAGQRERQRVAPGGPGAAVALGLALVHLQRRQPVLRGGQGGGGLLVPVVEVHLALVEPAGLDLQLLEVGLRAVDPGVRLLQRVLQATELGLGGRRPGAQRADLAGQPGQPLTAVGDRAHGGHQRLLLGGQGRLGVGAVGDGRCAAARRRRRSAA
jgi:hypothetical protein